MGDKLKISAEKLGKYKYPLIVLIIGALLMLLPGSQTSGAQENTGEEMVEGLLKRSEGVGEVRVLISDKGVIVVCAGADDASVRLDIMRAVSSYTGFTSDRITILKMADYKEEKG